MNRALVIFLLFCSPIFAADFYVNFDSGSDSNDGAQETPWKHAPGDPNSTSVPAGTTLEAGDTVLFRGGVTYRGGFATAASGAEGNPITYKGDGWGAESAIIDGTEIFSPSWTQCTSSSQCFGNANYAEIWFADAPVGFTLFTPFFEDSEFLWFSQQPKTDPRIVYKRIEDFYVIAYDDPDAGMTRTSITDPDVFTQSDPDFYDDCFALAWAMNNSVYTPEILSYDPASNTITMEQIGVLYTERDYLYSIIGSVGLMDTPGEFGFQGDTLYIWPGDSDDPSEHEYSISERSIGVGIAGSDYLNVEGFHVFGFFSEAAQEGVCIRAISPANSFLEITDNEVSHSHGYANILVGNDGTDIKISGNNVHWNRSGTGIHVITGARITVDDNIVAFVERNGIWLQEATDSSITRNVMSDIKSSHANGVSVYQASDNVLVAGNIISTGGFNFPITFSASSNLFVTGNLVDAMAFEYAIARWTLCTGDNYFVGNTVLRADITALYNLDTSWIAYNNILDGSEDISTSSTHNLYVGLNYDQNPDGSPAWVPQSAEILAADAWDDYALFSPTYDDNFTSQTFSDIFTDYEGLDFGLKVGSAAIGAGADYSSLYPTEDFPDYDFTVDLDGVTRTDVGGWDLGAYEYVADAPTPPTPSSGDRVMIRRNP